VDDHRQRIDRLVIDKDRQLYEVVFLVPDDRVVERGIALADRLQAIVEIEHHLVERQFVNEHGAIAGARVETVTAVSDTDSNNAGVEQPRQTTLPEEKKRLEDAFRQDLKNRIDETSKYVKPEEGTMDFAFMFIPAEAIYYDLLINKVGTVKSDTQDLIQYAFRDRHVIIVSPTSFLAYLQTVLQGLKALQIEESAKEIRKRVEMLGKHLSSYETYMQKLGTHLGTSVSMYNSAYKELGKIDKDVLKITGEAMEIEPELLERPEAAQEE